MEDADKVYIQAWVHKAAMVLIIVGALVWPYTVSSKSMW